MARSDAAAAHARAYVTLDALMRLRGRARGFSLLPRQPPGGALAGRHGSRLRGRGLDFAELRRYQDGDDVRMIDWRATARARAPYVRLYTEERDRVVLLVIDQRRTMFFGSRRATKSVAAAEVAALAAWRVVRAGDRIAAIVFDDEEQVTLRPSRRLAAVQHLLGEVARLNQRLSAAGGPPAAAMLNRALDTAARLATHDWLVVLISDGYGADAGTAAQIGTLNAHNDVAAVFVSDPLEAGLPALGPVVVAEGTARLAVDTGSARLRAQHAAAFADRLGLIQRFGRRRAIPVLPVRTDAAAAPQLRAALQGGHGRP